jgi:hypothetical protein
MMAPDARSLHMTNPDINDQKPARGAHPSGPRDSWEVLEMLVRGMSQLYSAGIAFAVKFAFNLVWIAALLWMFDMLPSGFKAWLQSLVGLG